MQPIVTDTVAWSCLSVGLSGTIMSLATVAKPMLFVLWTQVGPRNHVLDLGAHWCHWVNTIKPYMYVSDAYFLSN